MPPHNTTYYVYILARPNGKPFYVGKGKGKRVFAHDWEAKRGCPCHKCRIIRKIWRQGNEVQRYTVFTTNDETEALAYEVELITLYGRKNLANETDGGDGVSGRIVSPEAREKMRQRATKRPPHSAETRAKISAAFKGKRLSPAHAEKLRAFGNRPEIRAQNRAKRLGKTMSTEARAKIGAAVKGRKHTPEAIARMRAAQQNRSPETRAKISAATKKRMSNPEVIARLRLINRDRKPPSRRGAKDSPETRERKRAAALRYHAAKRAAQSDTTDG